MKLLITAWLLLLVYVGVFTLMCVATALWGGMRPVRWRERAWSGRRQIH